VLAANALMAAFTFAGIDPAAYIVVWLACHAFQARVLRITDGACSVITVANQWIMPVFSVA
jgi:hypothetical protein